MQRVQHNAETVEIARPAAEIFPYLIEAEKRKLWVQGLEEATPLDDGELGVGSRFRDVIIDHGQRTTVNAEVEEYEPSDSLAVRLEARGFESHVSYRLEELNGRTRVACSIDTKSTTVVARLAAPIVLRQAQKALRNSLATLKRMLEQ
jgi:uncharacterized protein YndB with AHSA1/START domain